MEKCAWCGCEFDVSSAKRSINRKYGVSTYEDICMGQYLCRNCVETEVSGAIGVGAEIEEYMDNDWDD